MLPIDWAAEAGQISCPTMSNCPIVTKVFFDNSRLIGGSRIGFLMNVILNFKPFGISIFYIRRHSIKSASLFVHPRIIILQILLYPTQAEHLYLPQISSVPPANFQRTSALIKERSHLEL